MSRSIKENFEHLSSTTQQYLESSIAYYKLDFFKKATKVAIDTSHKLILAFFLLIALLFLSVALSIYLGVLLDSLALGYLIVGVFYLIIMMICAATLKPVLKKIILSRASVSFFDDKAEELDHNQTTLPEDESQELQ